MNELSSMLAMRSCFTQAGWLFIFSTLGAPGDDDESLSPLVSALIALDPHLQRAIPIR